MAGYTPLFSSIVTSSIWGQDNATRIVWITMLALADSQGRVEGAIPGLAHVARVTLDECERALKALSEPDPYSRTAEHEGRRIHIIDGGWQIFNFAKFRQKAKSRAEYMRQYRERKKESDQRKETNNKQQTANKVTYGNTSVTGVTCYTIQQVKDACTVLGISEQQAESYTDHYGSQGWKKANGQPITELRGHMRKRWTGSGWDFDEKSEKKRGSNSDSALAKLKAEGRL